jgi:hypothetical protein
LYGAGTANNFLNGNVGIGNTSPELRLDILGSTSIVGMKIRNSTSGGYTELNCYNNGNTASDRMYMGVGGTTTGDAFQNRGYFFSAANLEGINFTANKATTGDIRFFTGGVNERMRIFGGGNISIGSTTDSGEKFQVTGTAKITGASSFGGNMTLSLNQNANTTMTVSNTTVGGTSVSEFVLQSNTVGAFGKTSSGYTTFKTIVASDFYMYNAGAGDITILNNFATGNIKFTSGGSSTEHMRLTSAGNLCIGITSGGNFLNIAASTTAKAQINLTAGANPTSPNNGDIWFDGTNLKMQIGGVTRTFTLI